MDKEGRGDIALNKSQNNSLTCLFNLKSSERLFKLKRRLSGCGEFDDRL